MTDRRSLSGSLDVTAGSGIRDSEGGATIGKMNIFRSEHEGHDIIKINNWVEARQDDIEKSRGKNDLLLIMLFRTYLTLPVSEF